MVKRTSHWLRAAELQSVHTLRPEPTSFWKRRCISSAVVSPPLFNVCAAIPSSAEITKRFTSGSGMVLSMPGEVVVSAFSRCCSKASRITRAPLAFAAAHERFVDVRRRPDVLEKASAID